MAGLKASQVIALTPKPSTLTAIFKVRLNAVGRPNTPRFTLLKVTGVIHSEASMLIFTSDPNQGTQPKPHDPPSRVSSQTKAGLQRFQNSLKPYNTLQTIFRNRKPPSFQEAGLHVERHFAREAAEQAQGCFGVPTIGALIIPYTTFGVLIIIIVQWPQNPILGLEGLRV